MGLDIALQALNIKNDEVIVSQSLTTVLFRIIKNGAKPVFIDLNVNSHVLMRIKLKKK